MSDYFSEYTSFVGNKGLPSPADTPYETPAFIRSKRNSRATTIGTHSREQSHSPPPLPPDPSEHQNKGRDGQYSALDPRRFTPTLHASLVAEILSLRRELDSKNNLVENLETGLAAVKSDNEQLLGQLTSSAKDVRVARAQVHQMENGTYEALETISTERNAAQTLTNELRLKLDVAQKKIRLQDDDAERTQSIWEREKDSWENERRQLERRVHVTETRLRKFVDEMVTQQTQPQKLDVIDNGSRFQDSGLGVDDSDNESASIPAAHHQRKASNASYRSKYSNREAVTTPEMQTNGFNLADELDDEEEYDVDDSDNNDELDYHEAMRRTMDSRQSFRDGEVESKAKRVLGLTDEVPSSPLRTHSRFGSRDNIKTPVLDSPLHRRTVSEQSAASDSQRKYEYEARPLSIVPEVPVEVQVLSRKTPSQYVDTGYQPSPPVSPKKINGLGINLPVPVTAQETGSQAAVPSSKTYVLPTIVSTDEIAESRKEQDQTNLPTTQYADSSTQTEVKVEPVGSAPHDRDSLQLPVLVPQIAIHPPTSRPTTPRSYVLPPGTKSASTQVELSWSGVDASMQTEEIRVDMRPFKLPPHLLPSYVLANVPEPAAIRRAREEGPGTAKIFETTVLKSRASLDQGDTPFDDLPQSREDGSKDLRSMPLKAITLPKPTLAPAFMEDRPEPKSQGPLNRSMQFGVSHDNRTSRLLANIDHDSETDDENPAIARAMSAAHRPSGRFTPSEHPRNVPEDKELSPERRPLTSDSTEAAPAPSIASSREGRTQSNRSRKRPPPKLNTYGNLRDRSPSFGSVESSNWSGQAGVQIPPYPIPTRSSSRQLPFSYSEGSWSPTAVDSFVAQSSKNKAARQKNLRKVQSTTSIRQSKTRVSPRKPRRRVRSPDLTPVQSMAFDSPAPGTSFPIPELPTPLAQGPSSDYQWGSRSTRVANTSISSMPYGDETGLVNAIAATMVGEWMWKYIRKRKSFGVGESAEDFAMTNENGNFDIPGIGTRHKRWVWLSPYEKTIMWDSKQPMNGTALLGKKGRKLIIQSVLDVQDDTALPKKPELETAHDRSILILTPVRALKFTCTTAERHSFWMTALCFLAESNRMESQLPPLPLVPPLPVRAPPPPPPPMNSRTKPTSPAFGRSTVRDSVRLAKNKVPEHPEDEGADFPAIPRLYSSTSKHQRKRSNTSPRLPPALSTLRSFSSTAVSTNSSQAYSRPIGSAGKGNLSNYSGSRDNSVAAPDTPFYDTTGTVRMEAFVDPNVKNGVLYVPAAPGQVNLQNRGRRRGDSSLSLTGDKRRGGYVFDEDGADPFRGF